MRECESRFEVWDPIEVTVFEFQLNDSVEKHRNIGPNASSKISFLNKHDFLLGIKKVNMLVSSNDIYLCNEKNNEFLELDWHITNQKHFKSF